MKRYEIEVAKAESRTPLFYYPYDILLKSDVAKYMVARYFFSKTTSYVLSMKMQDLSLLTDENMKELSGTYTFHYDDPQETEGTRIGIVKEAAPRAIGRKGIDGFIHFLPDQEGYGAPLEEGKDFEIIIGERVEIKQPSTLLFSDIKES